MGQGDIRRVTAWHLHLKVLPEIIRFYLLSLNLHVLSFFWNLVSDESDSGEFGDFGDFGEYSESGEYCDIGNSCESSDSVDFGESDSS